MRKFKQHFICAIMLFLCSNLVAQDNSLSGIIISSDDNSPLQGVTVTNAVSGKKSTTNTAGYYAIAGKPGDKVTFTYVAYVKQEYIIGTAKVHNISMIPNNQQLGGVVVTGYNINKSKRELTYQAVSVSGEEIAQTRRENFINSLAGRIPGATITSTTGMPGASSSIILRGPTSIDGNNQPIFVIDGLIVDNSSFEMKDRFPGNSSGVNYENRSNDFTNRGGDISPEDIESVTVLKGPEATSLYGSDGANGAIIITTKKGKKGKATVTYNNSFRVEKVYRLPEIQTVFDQGSAGITNQLVRTYFGQKIPDGNPRFDNIGNFFRTGKSQQHNLGIEGGGDFGSYRFTAAYINQEGVVPNTGYDRYNFRLNTTFKVNTKFTVTNSFSYIQSHTDKASKGTGGFLISLLTWPTDDDVRVYTDANGNKKTIRGDLTAAEDDNPFWDVNKNTSFDDNSRFLGNIKLSYDVSKSLNLTAITGIDFYSTNGTWYFHPQSNFARTVGGIINQYKENQRLINGAYRATYRKKIGNVANTLIGAFTFDTRKYEVNAVKGERLYDPNFLSINNADPITVGSLTSNENYNRFGAFINYTGNYKNWLNLSLSARMDGSSRLVNPLEYNLKDAVYYYWSAGTSVVFTDLFKEKLPTWIKYGKLRLNYATTGRDPRAAYVKGNKFSTSTFTGGGFITGTAQGGFTQGNPDLRPEFTKQLEYGAEMKFFNNRLGFDVAMYDLRTEDQLMAIRLSYASGAILKWINGGTAQNKGIELQVTGTPVESKKFTWNTTVNFSRNRNKILKMPAGLPFFYNSDTWIGNVRGQAIEGGTVYQLAALRYLTNTNGDLLISPTSGLPIPSSDYIVVADRQPDFSIGLVNSFSFLKNWNVSFNLDIRKGGDVYNGTEEFLYRVGMSKRTLDRETPRVIKGVLNDGLQNTANPTPNTIVIAPLFRSDYYTTGGGTSQDFIEKDVNWVRLRDVTLSYNIPTKILKRQKAIKNASVFFTGTDLFILTNYSGADPSTNANNTSARSGVGGVGMDQGNLATPRGLNFGLKVQF
jgi:TonB-linked SusC/RagA family outer membrane protein